MYVCAFVDIILLLLVVVVVVIQWSLTEFKNNRSKELVVEKVIISFLSYKKVLITHLPKDDF